jgi:hypothetical protein
VQKQTLALRLWKKLRPKTALRVSAASVPVRQMWPAARQPCRGRQVGAEVTPFAGYLILKPKGTKPPANGGLIGPMRPGTK